MKLREQKEDIYAGNLRFTQIETCARAIFLPARTLFRPTVYYIDRGSCRLKLQILDLWKALDRR